MVGESGECIRCKFIRKGNALATIWLLFFNFDLPILKSSKSPPTLYLDLVWICQPIVVYLRKVFVPLFVECRKMPLRKSFILLMSISSMFYCLHFLMSRKEYHLWNMLAVHLNGNSILFSSYISNNLHFFFFINNRALNLMLDCAFGIFLLKLRSNNWNNNKCLKCLLKEKKRETISFSFLWALSRVLYIIYKFQAFPPSNSTAL